MPQGRILKALSGFYYVLPEGSSTHELIVCRARGIFKKQGVSPLVGDLVDYETEETGEGTVTDIHPRHSELIRPPIANVELAALVFSVTEPALNQALLDKFLVHIEKEGLVPIICLTKRDLLQDKPAELARIDALVLLYKEIGYEVIMTSSKQGDGVQRIKDRLAGAMSVFAGQSGVGKSSLLNAMMLGLGLETNEISQKLGRGKHTTRHVELIPLPDGGYVADTPGFSQLDFMELEPQELGACFIEFASYAEHCKFRGCLHLQEPGCKVRDAVDSSAIDRVRYDNYVQFLNEMRDRKRRY